jgi:hypothetical protein
MTTDTPAAAAITAEREALIKELASAMAPLAKDSYRWPYWPGTWTFADACLRVLERRAALSAPVAAQPADSAMEADDLAILEAVRREMEENDGGNAPGHGHSIPGIWDYDNGAKAGKPCAWCLTWKKFTALIERDRARALTAASKERSKTHG